MSIKDLQTKIGVTADGAFGKGTLQAAAKFFNLTATRAAHFFAQTAHETGDFRLFSENLNYSVEGLLGTFKKYFPDTATASKYAHNTVMIANKVYANRMGNGNEASGDGWKYRGRGAIQLTGKANYQAFSSHINRPDVMTNPDIVATELAFESAIFFFDKNNLWTICDLGVDDDTISIVSKRINGGTLGLEDRKAKTKKYAMLL